MSDLLGTTWRRRTDGAIATVFQVTDGIRLTEADWDPVAAQLSGANAPGPARYSVADEAELRRGWVQVVRGWVPATGAHDIPSFTALDTFVIAGRGRVYVVTLDREWDGRPPLVVVGRDARIDGVVRRCTGVERRGTGYHGAGETIGLLCREQVPAAGGVWGGDLASVGTDGRGGDGSVSGGMGSPGGEGGGDPSKKYPTVSARARGGVGVSASVANDRFNGHPLSDFCAACRVGILEMGRTERLGVTLCAACTEMMSRPVAAPDITATIVAGGSMGTGAPVLAAADELAVVRELQAGTSDAVAKIELHRLRTMLVSEGRCPSGCRSHWPGDNARCPFSDASTPEGALLAGGAFGYCPQPKGFAPPSSSNEQSAADGHAIIRDLQAGVEDAMAMGGTPALGASDHPPPWRWDEVAPDGSDDWRLYDATGACLTTLACEEIHVPRDVRALTALAPELETLLRRAKTAIDETARERSVALEVMDVSDDIEDLLAKLDAARKAGG